MTPIIRRYIKASFLFLIAGLGLGGFLLVAQFALGVYPLRVLVTTHVHLLLVGFMLFLVMGVATWMFPRAARDDTRYRPRRAETVYWLVAAGTALRAAGEIALAVTGAGALAWAIVAGGLAQLAGTALFISNMWWRVRMPPTAGG